MCMFYVDQAKVVECLYTMFEVLGLISTLKAVEAVPKNHRTQNRSISGV
jgi:hypothetical protein